MVTEAIRPQTSHQQFYDFLPVLNEEQIVKLRNIVIGTKSPSSFSEDEITELKHKLQERQNPSSR
ncbi:MAG: hypothetical protein WCF67_11110 [Chitinophagaceae bacterium]